MSLQQSLLVDIRASKSYFSLEFYSNLEKGKQIIDEKPNVTIITIKIQQRK
jgi:hypothetical protein